MSYPNNPQWQQPYPPQPPPIRHTNAMAIVAFVMVFVFWPLAIVFGHIARGQIKRRGEDGKGFATAALILGYLALLATIIFVAVIVVVVVNAPPSTDQQNSTSTTVSTSVTETTEVTLTPTP